SLRLRAEEPSCQLAIRRQSWRRPVRHPRRPHLPATHRLPSSPPKIVIARFQLSSPSAHMLDKIPQFLQTPPPVIQLSPENISAPHPHIAPGTSSAIRISSIPPFP